MQISRRSVLKLAAAGVLAAPALSFGAAGDDKLILSAPLTHSDWMLKNGIAWGPAGVHHMLDACKACGWSRIYWRALDGGRALWASRIVRPEFKWDDDSFWTPQSEDDRRLVKSYNPNMTEAARQELAQKIMRWDYSTFDPLAEAVRYGHKIGLKIHAWVSINEDDHGWGLRSDFSKQHPQFRWVKRDGRVYHSQLSFAFKEVRDYKLSIVDELLRNYEIDGLFLDWIRTGDVRDNPQTDQDGVADSGYETPLIEQFKTKYKIDPNSVPNNDERWVQLRAEPQTIFMRAVRDRVKQEQRRLPICTLVAHPWDYRGLQNKIDGNLRGLLLDVSTWADEDLMDSAIAAGYYRDGGNPSMAFKALRDEAHGKVEVKYYGWVPNSVADFDRDFAAAKSLGAQELLFWEADYIDDRANAVELKAAMSANSRA